MSGAEYSLSRFNQLLQFRGVLRIKDDTNKLRHQAHRLSSLLGGATYPIFDVEDDDFVSTQATNLELDGVNGERRGSPDLDICDQDLFYASLTDQETVDGSCDDNFSYKNVGIHSDRRFSNNSERADITLLNTAATDALDTEDSLRWEHHDATTLKEMMFLQEKEESTDNGEMYGGVYDPFNPRLSILATENALQLLQEPPASKFRDLLRLTPLGGTQLDGVGNTQKFKNNLSTIMQLADGCEYMLVASRSEIGLYEFDPSSALVSKEVAFRFETSPNFTTPEHRTLLTWPYYPHTINFLTYVPNWLGEGYVGACVDNGSLVMWRKSSLENEILKQRNRSTRSSLTNTTCRILADITLGLASSAWGMDFASAVDNTGALKYVCAVSDNSRRVTLFFASTAGFPHQSSVQTMHNIPEVAIVDYTIESGIHSVIVSAASISGELLLFSFQFKEQNSSSNAMQKPEVMFKDSKVIYRTMLTSNCWTVKTVEVRDFMKVPSLRAMTGDSSIDEGSEQSYIAQESKITQLEGESVYGPLGGATAWQFFGVPVVSLASSTKVQSQLTGLSPKIVLFGEDMRRVHSTYRIMSGKVTSWSRYLSNKVLVVSTDSRLGLFRASGLHCCSASTDLFDLELPSNESTKWCNRIQVSMVVPELSCVIAATQLGIVTIMRLCSHRGVFGMRQEHIFPNCLLIIGESHMRIIVGLSLRDRSLGGGPKRFILYVVYSDGLVLAYKLLDSENESVLSQF